MVTINCKVNQKYLLLRILDNYKTYKKIDCKNGKITDKELEYDLTNINRLIDTIEGKRQVDDDTQLQSKEFREKNGRIRYGEDIKTSESSLSFNIK